MRPLRIQPRTARFHVRVGEVGLKVCEGGHRGGSPIHPSFAELALSGVGGHGRLPGRPRFEDLQHAAGRLAEEPHEVRVEGPAGAVVSHGHGGLGFVESSVDLELVGQVHYPGDQRNALTTRHAGGSRTIPTLEDEVQALDECCPEAHFHGHQPGHFAVTNELLTPSRWRVLEKPIQQLFRHPLALVGAKCSVTHVPNS